MLTQNEKNILSFIKPYALEDRKVLMKDDFIDEKIKNMTLEEIRETLVALSEKRYLNAKVFISDTVMVMEVLQKGLEFDKPSDEINSVPSFSFKRGSFIPDSIEDDSCFKRDFDNKIDESSKYKFEKNYENYNIDKKENNDKICNKNICSEDIVDSSSYYINNNTDYLDIKKMIFADDRIAEQDQNTLLKLITLIETMTDSNVPMPKGAFLEYKDVIVKYNWISDVIGRTIVNKFLIEKY